MPKGSFTYYVIACVHLVIEIKRLTLNSTEIKQKNKVMKVDALVGDETVKIGAIPAGFPYFPRNYDIDNPGRISRV